MDYIESILKRIVPEDREQVLKYKETGEDFKYHPRWWCLDCGKQFYLLENFKKRIVTCPHCGGQQYTKIYKNGRWSQSAIKR
ncbi:hypothetical protein UT300009_30210 [Paraclostridium bifermentans]